MSVMVSRVKEKAWSLLMHYGMVQWNNRTPHCAHNCSGHGDCINGTCFCEIQFVGEECKLTNTSYFAVFATVFFLVAFVCFVQLVMCIIAEWQRLKAPSFVRAFRITTQKLLYFVVFLATLIRGAYFTSPASFEEEGWSRGLVSAYYPLLLSGSSLIVCFWAEIFHLRDLKWKHRQFLSKSFIGFVVFNSICFSLLIIEFFISWSVPDPKRKRFYETVFNGCYAALFLIVLVFFLIYGIEVYFKIRGGFLLDETPAPTEEARQLFKNDKEKERVVETVDTSQLHQSRLGLLSQAFMLTFVVFFLWSETLGDFWKYRVSISQRNLFNLVFRVMEIGAALWFPCVLWNCISPEQLWILNPKKLFKTEIKEAVENQEMRFVHKAEGPSNGEDLGECWICYDSRPESGQLIQPCGCKGDVRVVHDNCLKKWFMESGVPSQGRKHCHVCGMEYRLTYTSKVGVTGYLMAQHWASSVAIMGVMAICISAAMAVVHLLTNAVAKVLTVGTALLVIYVCVRFLCLKQMEAYQRARVNTLNIESNLPTISDSLPLETGKQIAIL